MGFALGHLPRERHPSYAASTFCRFRIFTLRIHGFLQASHNICERVLKKAILHRKNALFYKTQNGAKVGDLFMSLIHTAELCAVDPFDYLVQLQRHAAALKANATPWMPWNYRDTIAGLDTGPDPPT